MDHQELLKNRDRILDIEHTLFERVSRHNYTALNVGCGTRVLEGFQNIDGYQNLPNVLNSKMWELESYSADSVDLIFCAHVLEHAPIRRVPQTIDRWYTILKDSGKLYLSMPDSELCMLAFLNPETPPDLKRFAKATIWGYQVQPGKNPDDINLPEDYGQYHLSGWTMAEMTDMLEKKKFRILEKLNYDGYGTPSMYFYAEKYK